MSESQYTKYCLDDIKESLCGQGLTYEVKQDDKNSKLWLIYIDKVKTIKLIQNAYNSGLKFHAETAYSVKFLSLSEYDSKVQESLF